MTLTDAQARAYIQGEYPFDELAWTKDHAERLADAIENAMKKGCGFENLRKTARHYIRPESPYMACNPAARKRIENLIEQMDR